MKKIDNLVLASASPRRAEIMKLMGLDFTVCPARNEENPENWQSPGEYAEKSAIYKAREVYSRLGNGKVILAADTVVALDGEILGKPADERDAVRMLRLLSGNIHTVVTGYSIIADGREVNGYEETEVEFRELSDDEINEYVASGEPLDKAGAYGIQGPACVFVKRINGDYFNVMGLPVYKTLEELKKAISVDIL